MTETEPLMSETATHVDLMQNDWFRMERKLVRRTQPDDPAIGAQVASGWATYYSISEPHTMAECPFADAGR